MKNSFLLSLLLLVVSVNLSANVIQQVDEGFLEEVQGQKILHLSGSHYQMGFQHGKMLKEQIQRNLTRFVDQLSSDKAPPLVQSFKKTVPDIMPFIPDALMSEMEGMAAGAELPLEKIILLNLFPEMFHCSAITVSGAGTTNGELYHVRVLDYSAANSLQDTAILMVGKPLTGNAFLNVTYAGFIGSVTGMNAQHIAIGEIGGKGYGKWKGLPMAFLLRILLEQASSLEDVQKILAETTRTCEYYYIFSDGKNGQMLAAYATPEKLEFIQAGTGYQFQYQEKPIQLIAPPKDSIVMTRWEQYDLLLERFGAVYGHVTVADLQEMIKQPIAHPSNLHNAIFVPGKLEVWISNAGPHNEPACDQPYYHYSLPELLSP